MPSVTRSAWKRKRLLTLTRQSVMLKLRMWTLRILLPIHLPLSKMMMTGKFSKKMTSVVVTYKEIEKILRETILVLAPEEQCAAAP